MTSLCPLCTSAKERVVDVNPLAWALCDAYPVAPGHMLIVPWRHVASYFGVTP